MIDEDRFRRGEDAYFRELLEELGPLVWSVVRSFSPDPDEADELYQQIWVKVFRRRHAYQSGSFRSWLIVLARNHCRDAARRAGAYGRMVDRYQLFEVPEPQPTPFDLYTLLEETERVRLVLGKLPPRQRDALLYRIERSLSTAQIAELMGVNQATVRSFISKGLATLRSTSGDAA